MTVRLRPHHLLCMLTFIGKGYTEAFTQNYVRIAARLSEGEDILVVEGPDDICAPLLDEPDPHCWEGSVSDRDWRARKAVEELLGTTAGPDSVICPDADFLARMRYAFAVGEIRKACIRCEWSSLCTDVAAGGYDGVLVAAKCG